MRISYVFFFKVEQAKNGCKENAIEQFDSPYGQHRLSAFFGNVRSETAAILGKEQL